MYKKLSFIGSFGNDLAFESKHKIITITTKDDFSKADFSVGNFNGLITHSV